MFRRKLHNHEAQALKEALACMEALCDNGIQVDENAMSTLRAMLGIRGTMPDYLNEAIAECVEREREVA